MAFYSTREYWNERYQWTNDDDVLEETFDWYVPYAIPSSDGSVFAAGIGMRDEVLSILPKQRNGKKLLIVGCGISPMGEQLYDDGFTDILCVDISETCIKRMQRRQQLMESKAGGDEAVEGGDGRPPKRPTPAREGLVYAVLDCQRLCDVAASGTFDAVIDKGMIDATFCDEDVQRQYDRVAKIMENIYDVLRPGAPLIHVTPHKETGGSRGVIFRNPVLPWSCISAVKLDLTTPGTTASSGASSFYDKPYWMYQLVK